jgi:hypothetical protein
MERFSRRPRRHHLTARKTWPRVPFGFLADFRSIYLIARFLADRVALLYHFGNSLGESIGAGGPSMRFGGLLWCLTA